MDHRTSTCGHSPPRRTFLRLLGFGGSAGLLAPNVCGADQEPAAPDDPAKAEADARMALVAARFGTHLDDSARAEVRKQVDGVVRQGRQLRAVALDNSDAPFPIFRPHRTPLA